MPSDEPSNRQYRIKIESYYTYYTFKQVNIQKAAGTDGLPGRVLKSCTDQLASVFTDIFNFSLTQSIIPKLSKKRNINFFRTLLMNMHLWNGR